MSDTPALSEIGPQLLVWIKKNLRDLPWRSTRDPWKILVAECMLQQTQVARVIPKWSAFLEEFPTPTACAAAPLARILWHWDGLGYNRRAIQLHALAEAIVNDHAGAVPDDLEDLLRLPGIGPYTARAIRVFAYEYDDAVVDTNVGRIIARAVVGRPVNSRRAQEMADALVPLGEGWIWNQGLLDFGATVCTKKSPTCETCPIEMGCVWRSAMRQLSRFSGGAERHRQASEVGVAMFQDPAVGSAAVSGKQSRFEGSDRQGRGRLLRALHKCDVGLTDLEHVMGWPGQSERASRVAASLVADGLASLNGSQFSLPRDSNR